MMKRVLDFLQRKGPLASLLGFATALPVNLWAVLGYFNDSVMSDAQMKSLVVLNIIAWIWVVLPSRIVARFGNSELVIED